MARTAKKEDAMTSEEKLAQSLVPETEHPYHVPQNWCWAYLPALCDYMRAGGDKPKNMSTIKTEEYQIPVVANGLQDEGIIGYTDIENEKAGTVTVSGRGTIGHSVLRDYPYYPVIRLIVLAPNKAIISEYLKYVFDYFEEEGTGTSIPQLTVPSLKSKSVPLPPIAEQQRIVDRIESLFAKLDEAKEKAQAVVDGFEDSKAAILHKAFTGELTADWRNTHGVAIDDWENAPLETVFQLRSGSTIDASEEQEYGAIPYVKVADMNLPENEIQITTSSRFVDECPERHVIPRGSTIFPKRGGAILTNKKRYVGVEKIIADLNTMAIMPIVGRAYGWYGYYWMQSVDLRQLNNGSNVPQINNKDMVKLFVPTPSIDEQKAIVGILDSVFDKEIEAKETAGKVIDQIDTMKKSILARAFRGELGTNDPADESAEELLKRVL